jgi:hypothetical protein
MTTPEGRVKNAISTLLKRHSNVYYFMPVQFGMGASGVDYHCVVEVLFNIDSTPTPLPIAFFIEAKRPGEDPTDRQDQFLKDRREKQHCKTFVIDEDPTITMGSGLEELEEWLNQIWLNNERLRKAPAS